MYAQISQQKHLIIIMLKLVNESDKRGKFSLLAVLLPTFKQENSINLHITFLVRKMTTYIS